MIEYEKSHKLVQKNATDTEKEAERLTIDFRSLKQDSERNNREFNKRLNAENSSFILLENKLDRINTNLVEMGKSCKY